MNLKTGIDLIEIPRLRAALERFGERFLERIFTPHEIAECRGRAEALAACFAAKEAASKALGTGIGPIGWREVEVRHHPSGEPYLVLYGRAADLAASAPDTAQKPSPTAGEIKASAMCIFYSSPYSSFPSVGSPKAQVRPSVAAMSGASPDIPEPAAMSSVRLSSPDQLKPVFYRQTASEPSDNCLSAKTSPTHWSASRI